jgi:hypothetical protein
VAYSFQYSHLPRIWQLQFGQPLKSHERPPSNGELGVYSPLDAQQMWILFESMWGLLSYDAVANRVVRQMHSGSRRNSGTVRNPAPRVPPSTETAAGSPGLHGLDGLKRWNGLAVERFDPGLPLQLSNNFQSPYSDLNAP